MGKLKKILMASAFVGLILTGCKKENLEKNYSKKYTYYSGNDAITEDRTKKGVISYSIKPINKKLKDLEDEIQNEASEIKIVSEEELNDRLMKTYENKIKMMKQDALLNKSIKEIFSDYAERNVSDSLSEFESVNYNKGYISHLKKYYIILIKGTISFELIENSENYETISDYDIDTAYIKNEDKINEDFSAYQEMYLKNLEEERMSQIDLKKRYKEKKKIDKLVNLKL